MPTDDLERGRELFARRAWADAFEALSLADRACALDVEDLERLGASAALAGKDDDCLPDVRADLVRVSKAA
jgi:hypothetical protein